MILLRLAALLAAFFFLRWLGSWVWRNIGKRVSYYTPGRPERAAAPLTRQGTIKRDPVCGTYVDVEVSVQEIAEEETLYFCSADCRDTYRARPDKVGARQQDEQVRQPLGASKTG